MRNVDNLLYCIVWMIVYHSRNQIFFCILNLKSIGLHYRGRACSRKNHLREFIHFKSWEQNRTLDWINFVTFRHFKCFLHFQSKYLPLCRIDFNFNYFVIMWTIPLPWSWEIGTPMLKSIFMNKSVLFLVDSMKLLL